SPLVVLLPDPCTVGPSIFSIHSTTWMCPLVRSRCSRIEHPTGLTLRCTTGGRGGPRGPRGAGRLGRAQQTTARRATASLPAGMSGSAQGRSTPAGAGAQLTRRSGQAVGRVTRAHEWQPPVRASLHWALEQFQESEADLSQRVIA